MQTMYNPLEYVDQLKAVGVPEEQAKVHAYMFQNVLSNDLATKRDIADVSLAIEQLRADTKRDIEELRTELKRDIEGFRTEHKDDIEKLRLENSRDLALVKADMLKWIAGMFIAQGAVVVSLIKLL